MSVITPTTRKTMPTIDRMTSGLRLAPADRARERPVRARDARRGWLVLRRSVTD
jgi:hypothetical protein